MIEKQKEKRRNHPRINHGNRGKHLNDEKLTDCWTEIEVPWEIEARVRNNFHKNRKIGNSRKLKIVKIENSRNVKIFIQGF